MQYFHAIFSEANALKRLVEKGFTYTDKARVRYYGSQMH